MSSAITYPPSLPAPRAADYGIEPKSNIIKTRMSSGPSRNRLTSTDKTDEIKVSWLLNQDQYALFEAWYEHKAKGGTAYFDIELSGGIGMSVHSARFIADKGPYYSYKAPNWLVTATLETRNRPTLTEDHLDFLVTQEPTAFFASVDVLNNFINSPVFGGI